VKCEEYGQGGTGYGNLAGLSGKEGDRMGLLVCIGEDLMSIVISVALADLRLFPSRSVMSTGNKGPTKGKGE
jgi:hypothetical protein